VGREFDEQLRQRLIAFQTQRGLPANGVADTETWTALVSGAQGQDATAETGGVGAATGPLLLSQTVLSSPLEPIPEPEIPPEAYEWTQIPGEGFGEGLGEGLEGEIIVGGESLGQGTFTATTGFTTGGEILAEGAVAVGETAAADGMALSGAALVTGEAAVSAAGLIPVIGIVVLLTGAIILIASLPAAEAEEAPQGDAGVTLPGGLATDPMTDPGTPGPATVPGQDDGGPASAPGLPGTAPVEEPGIIDEPIQCAKLNNTKRRHQHHIFPQEYVNEFDALDIEIDDYTVWLDYDQHIGPTGVHTVLDWNGEWADFFHDIPVDLTPAQITYWQQKAAELATDLLNRAGIAHKPIEPYRKR